MGYYQFIQTTRHYLLYSISLILYYLTTPYRLLASRLRSEKSPENRKKIFILVAVLAVTVIAAAFIIGQFFVVQQQQQQQQNSAALDVKFIRFELDKHEIVVGETSNVLINVQSSEDMVIDDAKVVVTIDPPGYEPYISISNSPIQLPVFLGKDARAGEVKVSITATDSPPAKEAVYGVKGMVFVKDTQTDIKEFPLTIRQ
jgi:cytochrome bd-type quinol oxidase subunit 1